MHYIEKLNRLILGIIIFWTGLSAASGNFRGLSASAVTTRPIPLSFSHLVESTYGIPRLDLNLERGTFLIIADQIFETYVGSYLDTLVAFKRSQGFKTVFKTMTEFGTTADEIKASLAQYLQDDPMLEYVLLIGDVDGLGAVPSYYYGSENDVTDQKYTHISGNDFLPDFFIGRFSVDSFTEFITMMKKTINYHRDPLAGTGSWLDQALVVAGNYSNTIPIPITPVWTSRWLRDRLLDYGYLQADTVYYPPIQQGATLIQAAINSGVGLVNYRGWGDANGWHYPEFHVPDVAGLNNGNMTPVFTSFVCNSADFANNVDPCLGEALTRAGNPTVSKGAVAIVGPSDLHTSTKFNNVINTYMYDAMLDNNVLELGPAMLAGQMGLLTEFPQLDGPGEGQEIYFHVYNILGDPSLSIHVLTPAIFTITAETVTTRDGLVDVLVHDSHGQPVSEAVVALLIGAELVARGITDSAGRLVVQLTEPELGNVDVFVNKSGFVQGHLELSIGNASRDLVIFGIDLEDTGGTVVEFGAPGQILTVFPRLKNLGTAVIPAGSITALTGAGLQPIDVTCNHPEIQPAQEVVTNDPLVFRIREFGDQSGRVIDLLDNGGMIGQVIIPVVRPVFQIDQVATDLQPASGFSGGLSLINHCAAAWNDLTAVLISHTDSLTISDSIAAAFTLSAWGQAEETAAFSGQVGYVASGSGLSVQVKIYQDTILVYSIEQDLLVLPGDFSDPVPPSPYGYWAYDNFDTGYNSVPNYNWVELFTNSSAELFRLDDDDHVNLSLPFEFQYFGTVYDRVTINSNGWISFIPCAIDYFWNYSIPMALGPSAQVAAFWDDLEVVGSDSIRVYTWFDAANGRFIIEWDQALNGYDEITAETFEIILYDQVVQPTTSGDGVIDIQYFSIADVDISKNYSTVGIESPDQNEGVQYLFNNSYAPGATPLQDGLTIRFTTAEPAHYVAPLAVDKINLPENFQLMPAYPNPFNPRTQITFKLPRINHINITIYDLLGRRVLTLTDGQYTAGQHTLIWNGRNSNGVPVSSGTYFVVARSAGNRQVNKLLLLK